jgi:hypothetical protein
MTVDGKSRINFHFCISSVVVQNANVSKLTVLMTKNNSKLIVDPNRIEIFQIPLQLFESVSRRYSQLCEHLHKEHLLQFSLSDKMELRRKPLRRFFGFALVKNILSCFVSKFQIQLIPLLPQDVKNIIKYPVLLSFAMVPVACVSRAPTDCELDKRARAYPSSFCDSGAVQTNLPNSIHSEGNTGPKKPMAIPVREAPLVKKIWVADQILDGGHWMQGTWLFVEVEKWVGTVSSGSLSETSVSLNSGSENTLGSKIKVAKSTPKTLPSEATKPATPAKSKGGAQ